MHFLSLVLFSIILYNERTFGLPQNWASSTDGNEGFDWRKEAKKSSGRGLSGDEDSEMIPSTILEQHQVRQNKIFFLEFHSLFYSI